MIPAVTDALQFGVAVALVGLAVAVGRARSRPDGQAGGGLAVAVGSLAAVALLGRVQYLVGEVRALEAARIATFLASGLALLHYRHRRMPLPRRVLALASGAAVAAAAAGVAAGLPAHPASPRTLGQNAVSALIVAVWFACVAEPVARFWIDARGRPRVQRSRMRALALGFGLIVALLVVALAGSSDRHPALLLLLQAASILVVPLIGAALVPPGWLRRAWRASEEGSLRAALGELLETPDRRHLAGSALGWGARLVGGEGGFVVDERGDVLASEGIPPEQARRLAEGFGSSSEPRIAAVGAPRAVLAAVVPLRMRGGTGVFVVVAGPFTPFFGSEELNVLGRYATSVATALDRARLVDELRAQRDLYEKMHEAISDLGEGFLVTDGREILYANEALSRINGYTFEELRALPSFLDVVAEEDRAELATRMARRLRGEPLADHYEIGILRKEGGRVRVEVAAKRIDLGERPGIIALCRDVTVRAEAERRLRESEQRYAEAYAREREAAERLRALDEMKNAFLAAVSHELRTPLTSVIGFAHTLEENGDRLSPEDRSHFLGRLGVNARRLEVLLNDLLDLDRLRRGILEPRRRWVALRDLVRVVLEDADLGADARVRVEVDGGRAWVDPAKVERILENLLANAVRHTPAGTPIWVRAWVDPQGTHLAVEDAGPGVPAETRREIFEPFRRGRPDGHAPGVGIGLSLVARFAALHGGRAWVEDRPGGGASFRVTLPADLAAPASA